ncbi:uncharacterized protein LOC127724232 isoform X2 [Mytilus californianus]|uniref:uncharacterized protein LOC127724232 isoform X2 n=1 Tax=Mytilus californianus TaxID=6549 RepID=UPI0022461FDC|nr:uncharacterized protein LOC127724232 isoform X2 [Mytilus californianus]
MCCRFTCVFYIDLLCSFMLNNYDSFANYVGTKHKKETDILIKKVRILLLRLGIGYLINIACFLIVCFVNRKTKDEGEGGFLLFCSIVIFAVCFYAFITFSLVYRISRFSSIVDNSKAEYKVSKYQKFMMVYKCLDVIFDIAVLLYSFILSDWKLTAFTIAATAVLCTDVALNVIVLIKNCCSDEERSDKYRSSENNPAFEIPEDGSNAMHRIDDYREESVSWEGPDLERLPPKTVSLSDTSVNRRSNRETDYQQKSSHRVIHEVHEKVKEQKFEMHPPHTLQGCENVDRRSMKDNRLQQTSSYQGMHTDSQDLFDRGRGPHDGIPQKFSDSYDHDDEFEQRKTDNTEFYKQSNSERPPPYSTVIKDKNNRDHDVSEEKDQEKYKEKFESKRNKDMKNSNIEHVERNDRNAIESRRTSRRVDIQEEELHDEHEHVRNIETKKSNLERDNLYSLESRPTNRLADDPDEENQEEHEHKTCIETRKSNLESSNRYFKEPGRTQSSVDVQDEDFPEEYIPASTNEIHKSNLESSNCYPIEPRHTQRSVDVQEEDFPEGYIPANTNEINNIEDSSEYCEEPEVEKSPDVVKAQVATSDFNTSSDWVEFEEKFSDAVDKDLIEDCEV